MLSIIVKEHEETPDKIDGMILQISKIPIRKELIFSTSKKTSEFLSEHGKVIDQYDFDIGAVYNKEKNSGYSYTLGCLNAKGDNLLVLDCHICCPPQLVSILIDTLEKNPYTIVTPGINDVDFPSCSLRENTGIGYGFKVKISNEKLFEWIWLPKYQETPYTVPLSCGGAFAMKSYLFDVLYSQGGFRQAFDFEEEKSMRLWRMGFPTIVEPRAVFGHWFKPHMASVQADNWYKMRVVALYCNLLDQNSWNRAEKILSKAWGKLWYDNLEYAKTNYSWLRDTMIEVDMNVGNHNIENWFIEVN